MSWRLDSQRINSMMKKIIILVAALATATTTLFALTPTEPKRLAACSPWYSVQQEDIELYESYTWYDHQLQQRFHKLNICDKALDMISKSEKNLIICAFLFDCLYPKAPAPRDIVTELTNAAIARKKEYPEMTVILILDPVNKAYGNRTSPAVKKLVENGIDVFYSDLLATKSATKLGIGETLRELVAFANTATLGISNAILHSFSRIKLPIKNSLDEKGMSIEMLWTATALKANHRKLIVADINGRQYETLVTSANPHNASVPAANYALCVKGPLSRYVYMVLRADAMYSAKIKDCIWSDKSKSYRKNYFKKQLPAIDYQPQAITDSNNLAKACFVSEIQIKNAVLEMLKSAKPQDQIRIQMFYLSELGIVEQFLETAKKSKAEIKVLLDPNKDSFNLQKDGTPNRQVAAYLMQKKKELGLNLTIRWYDTHGEQNHAKIMSITNKLTSKYELINGSCNWSGKNINDINMEANIFIKDAPVAVNKFNKVFDMLWSNSDGKHYTIEYHGKYEKHAGMHKWIQGEKWGYVLW